MVSLLFVGFRMSNRGGSAIVSPGFSLPGVLLPFFSEFQPWIPGDGASLCLFFPEDALPAGRFYFCFEGGWHKGKRTEEHILVKNTIFCPQSTEGGPPGA